MLRSRMPSARCLARTSIHALHASSTGAGYRRSIPSRDRGAVLSQGDNLLRLPKLTAALPDRPGDAHATASAIVDPSFKTLTAGVVPRVSISAANQGRYDEAVADHRRWPA